MKISRSLKITVVSAVIAAFSVQSAFGFGSVSINGAGSTFAQPLISACAPGWQAKYGTTVNYSGGGSGTGRKNSDNAIGNFNFSDTSYTPANPATLHIPVVAAPVAIAYNIDAATNKTGLYLSQKTLSGIFAGQITQWDDPAIVADNTGSKSSVIFKKDARGAVVKVNGKPVVLKKATTSVRVSLPEQPIRIIFRADSSGTTQNLLNFFVAQFPNVWTNPASGIFATAYPNPKGLPFSSLSASGSSGVATLAAATPYSITYVESSYANSNSLGLVSIKNAAGNFQGPTAAGTVAFLSAATATSSGVLTFNYATTDPGAYVLGIVSYALVDSSNTGDWASATTSFLKYLLSDSCINANPALGYASISGTLLATDNALLAKLAQ